MIARITNVIHRWLGWCPHVNAQIRNEKVLSYYQEVIPPGSGSYKERVFHWLGLFRNQTILQTIGTFCIGFYMFAGLGGVSHWNFFLVGILAGLPFSVVVGVLYWRIFNEILCDGPVVLWNRYDKTWGILTGVSVAASLCIWTLVFLGKIPGVSLEMTSAFFGGIIAVSFIGMLVSVWRWESDTHRQLHYDGLILELEKEADACTSLKY